MGNRSQAAVCECALGTATAAGAVCAVAVVGATAGPGVAVFKRCTCLTSLLLLRWAGRPTLTPKCRALCKVFGKPRPLVQWMVRPLARCWRLVPAPPRCLRGPPPLPRCYRYGSCRLGASGSLSVGYCGASCGAGRGGAPPRTPRLPSRRPCPSRHHDRSTVAECDSVLSCCLPAQSAPRQPAFRAPPSRARVRAAVSVRRSEVGN